jgi:hypothetical protein
MAFQMIHFPTRHEVASLLIPIAFCAGFSDKLQTSQFFSGISSSCMALASRAAECKADSLMQTGTITPQAEGSPTIAIFCTDMSRSTLDVGFLSDGVHAPAIFDCACTGSWNDDELIFISCCCTMRS